MRERDAHSRGELQNQVQQNVVPNPNPPIPIRIKHVAWWRQTDTIISVLLFLITLFARLYKIELPHKVVFDETHFTKFTTWYRTGHYYVDIHPPLAKLVFAWALKFFTSFEGAREDNVQWWTKDGFVGTSDWELLYSEDHGKPYIVLRMVSAVIGSLLTPVVYLTARAMGCRRVVAFFAVWLTFLESIIALQSRLILCDIFLYFFNIASIGASFASTRPNLSTGDRTKWVIITGLMLGCAVSVKLTALGTIAIVGIHQVLHAIKDYLLTNAPLLPIRPRRSKKYIMIRTAVYGTLMLAVVGAVFVVLWAIHLHILPYNGQGDNFMNKEFRMTLVPPPLNSAGAKLYAPEGGVCPVQDANKVDCWDKEFTLNAATCNARGCCWQTHPVPGIPWCFHTIKEPEKESLCPNRDNVWSDCGHPTITREECEAKGCCYDPTSTQNWCYHVGKLERPKLSFYAQLKETLRATWANNNGGAVMEHPFMSEWYEWPTMNYVSVPFSETEQQGGFLRAMSNPMVSWGVLGCIIIWAVIGVISIFLPKVSRKVKIKVKDISDDEFAIIELNSYTNQPTIYWLDGASGMRIEAITVWFGYFLNLVPYTLIARSKFTYHYIPALMVGMLSFAALFEWFWRTIEVRCMNYKPSGKLDKKIVEPTATSNLLSTFIWILLLSCYVIIGWGFWYWGLPLAYGYPLSFDEWMTRRWIPRWYNMPRY